MREDRLLLRRLRQGDQGALRRLYEKYKDDLLTVAVCLVADLPTAEDCLHDVFVRFAAGAAEVRLRGDLKKYLTACVANRARDQLRKNSRRVPLSEVADTSITRSDPQTSAINHEETARLVAALAELPYEQRETIVLHLHGQLKFREIARQLNLSTNTVQSRYRYGLGKLRQLLNSGERR